MKRLLYGAYWTAAALVLLAAAASAWLVSTNGGLQLAWTFVSPFVPEGVSVGRVDGSIGGTITLTDIEIETSRLRVSIARVEADWRPLALLGGTLAIDSLQVRDLEATRTPPAAAAAPTRLLPESIALPFDLVIDRAQILRASLRLAAADEPIVFDRVDLGLVFTADVLRVGDLVAQGPLVEARGQLNVAPRDDYAADGTLDWTFRLTDYPAVRGATRVSGTLAALTVVQHLEPPYALDAEVTIRDLLATTTLAGNATVDLVPQDLQLDWPIARLAGAITIAGEPAALAVTGRLALPAPELVDTTLTFAARYDERALAVESLRLTDPTSGASIDLSGRIALAAEPTLDLAGRWASLQWPLRGPPLATSPTGTIALSGTPKELRAALDAGIAGGFVQATVQRNSEQLGIDVEWRDLAYPQRAPTLRSPRGTLRVDGRPDNYRLMLDAEAIATAEPEAGGHVRASGIGTLSGLEFERLDIAVLGGTLEGSGAVAWDPALKGSVALALRDVDPSIVSARWPGRIGGRVAASATADSGVLTLHADELDLAGTLRDRPFGLTARGEGTTRGTARVEQLELRAGGTSLAATGTVGSELDFDWTLASPTLDDLWPELAGTLSSKGHLGGPRARPRLTIDATGEDVAFGEWAAGSLRVSAALDTDPAGSDESRLELTLLNARDAERSLERLELQANGTAASHTLTAMVAAEGVQADFGITGSVERAWQPEVLWQFALERATVGPPTLAPWTLQARATGQVTATSAKLDEACWQAVGGSLCFDADYSAGSTGVHFALRDLPMLYFSPYLPVDTTITGTMAGTGSVAFERDRNPELAVELATSSYWIGSGEAGNRDSGLTFAPGRASATWDADRLALDVALPLEGDDGGLEVRATARRSGDEPFLDSSLEGDLHLAFSDLRIASGVVRGIEDTGGVLAADLRLAGTLASPHLLGDARLTNGTARLIDPGIVLENATATLQADGGQLRFEAAASSGGGEARATGSLRLEAAMALGRIDIQGTNFEFLGLPTVRALASPNLRLELTPTQAELTGQLLVPEAMIELVDPREGVARVSPDQIIVDTPSRQTVTLLRPLVTRVALELGDKVTFDGRGLEGRIEGALAIVETPGEPANGTGELRIVQGTYEAYRQRLDIRTGRLLFAGGPLGRPGLDIEAVRRPTEDILVGARIRGTLDQPVLTVFSEPGMPREQQLSYLILGRPLERASSSESSSLSQAAVLLGLGGSDLLAERLNRSLGFDEFGIRTQSGAKEETASFVIGRYLAPSLYVSYGIGLFEQLNTLRLRYRITDRWRLETESSTDGSGGDVFYHIERGD